MPTPQTKKNLLIIAGLGLAAALSVAFAWSMLSRSGLTAGPDEMFGDQHLKTALALIELHKVRHGEYPETLRDLEFVGNWDRMALGAVRYRCNEERSAYYLEVTRGWMGKPDLELPEGFWEGTGYDPSLASEDGDPG